MIEIARLDTAGILAPPAGSVLASGYDPVYREPVKVPQSTDDNLGTSARVELEPVQIPAQIEAEQFDKMQMLISGNSPAEMFRCILHFRDLERLALVKSNGVAAFSQGDRLIRIMSKRTLETIQFFPQGLYVEHALPRGWGLSPTSARRNLLFLDFRARDQSSR